MKFITFVLMFLMFFFVSCGSDTVKTNKTGEEGYPCYNNKTCNGELVCVNDICVDPVSDTDNTDVDVVDETSDSDDIEDTEPIDNDSVEPDLDIIDDTDIIEEDIDNIEDSETEEDIEEDTDIIEPDNTLEDIDNIPDEDTVEMYNDCVVPAEGLENTLLNWDCIGGNWWSKEIMKHSVASGRIIQTSTEFLNEIQSDCNNIGGRLSTITEYRKAMNKITCPNFSYPEVEGSCKISDNYTDISYDNFGNCGDCSVLDKKLTYVISNKSFNIKDYDNKIKDGVFTLSVLENSNYVQFYATYFPYKASGFTRFWYQCVKI